ncbi:MAG: EutP/PduV family microcompartment system protein [Brevinemataceae bacterium]
MKKIMVIGPPEVGKTTLLKYLNQMDSSVHKTLVPEYYGDFLDTPGEYLQHKLFYSRLQMLSCDYDIVIFMLSGNVDNIYIPPNFSTMFPNKKIIGIVTKTDLASHEAIQKSREILHQVGVEELFEISIFDPKSITALKSYIDSIK